MVRRRDPIARAAAEPAFVRWASAEGISLVGSAVTTIVLPLVVFEATGSITQTGALYAVRVVPYLLFGIIAGPIADQGNRRVLIIGGNVAEGLLVATIPIAHAFGVLTVAQVYVVGLLSATAFVFSDAAVFGAVPALVGPERLSAANGFLSALASGADIAGPVIGGALAATIGPANAVTVDAASFLVAAALQSTIRSSFRTGSLPTGERLPIMAQVKRALRFVRGHRTVATLIGVGFGNSFAFGAVLGLLVPYGVTELGLSQKDARIGLLYGATGIGALVAGVVFARLFRTDRVAWLTPTTLLLSSVVAAGLAFASGWVAAAVLLTVFSWSIATTINVGITYRQLAAPDDLRSSVNVLGRMISLGGQPFRAACGAVVAGEAGIPVAYVGAAIVMAVKGTVAAVLLAGRPTEAVRVAGEPVRPAAPRPSPDHGGPSRPATGPCHPPGGQPPRHYRVRPDGQLQRRHLRHLPDPAGRQPGGRQDRSLQQRPRAVRGARPRVGADPHVLHQLRRDRQLLARPPPLRPGLGAIDRSFLFVSLIDLAFISFLPFPSSLLGTSRTTGSRWRVRALHRRRPGSGRAAVDRQDP